MGKFIVYTVIACAIWCTALCSLGYSLGSSYNHVLKAFSYAATCSPCSRSSPSWSCSCTASASTASSANLGRTESRLIAAL